MQCYVNNYNVYITTRFNLALIIVTLFTGTIAKIDALNVVIIVAAYL